MAAHAPRRTTELELKLQAPPGFELPALDGEPLAPRRFLSVYHDSADFRLARAGITLRCRHEDGRDLWQLKLPRGAARLELELPGEPAVPPAPLAAALGGVLRGAGLQAVARLGTRRGGVRVRERGEEVADVTVDAVEVLDEAGRVTGGFTELEIESVGGGRGALRRIAATLERAGARSADSRPKVLQALDLDFRRSPPGPDEPPAEHLRARLGDLLLDVLAYDPAVRLGGDSEDLHQLRVATRRCRALLRAGRPLLARDRADSLRAELGWLGGLLGPVRDLDVLVEHLEAEAKSLERGPRRAFATVLAALRRERDGLEPPLREALESPRYAALLDALEALADERAPGLADVSLHGLAAREYRRLRRAMRALPARPEDDELHETRILAKRARYTAELAEGTVGPPAAEFVAAARAYQDVVGEHQDAVVATARLQALASGAGKQLALAVSQLVERQHVRRAAARKAYRGVWKRLEKVGERVWA